jgi:hypothetical protein
VRFLSIRLVLWVQSPERKGTCSEPLLSATEFRRNPTERDLPQSTKRKRTDYTVSLQTTRTNLKQTKKKRVYFTPLGHAQANILIKPVFHYQCKNRATCPQINWVQGFRLYKFTNNASFWLCEAGRELGRMRPA